MLFNNADLKKILIIQTAFIGDVILATPIIEALHEKYPSAAIDLVVRKGNQGLFKGHPFVRHVLVWDKKDSKYKHLFILILALRRQGYDLLINCQRFAASGILAALSKAKIKIGFDKNPFSRYYTHKVKHSISDGMHECDRNMELLKPIQISGVAKPKLYPPEIALKPVKPYVCIAPSSVWFTKQWPEHKWVELIRGLDNKYSVYLLGSPQDEELCNRIVEQVKDYKAEAFAGKIDLLESAALMKGAKMNFVNDSAPMHLCSAVDAPVTAIYCSTVPSFGFGPLSNNSKIIEITENLSCRPCGLHGYKACPRGHFDCAEKIDVDQVLSLHND